MLKLRGEQKVRTGVHADSHNVARAETILSVQLHKS